MPTITQVVAVQKTLSTIKKALSAAGLNDLLGGKAPFTVFAPSDVAFGKLPVGTIDELLVPENKEKLMDLLKHHIVNGKIEFKDLKDGTVLKSVLDEDLILKRDEGKMTVNGAFIQTRDLESSNGILHLIDRVMVT